MGELSLGDRMEILDAMLLKCPFRSIKEVATLHMEHAVERVGLLFETLCSAAEKIKKSDLSLEAKDTAYRRLDAELANTFLELSVQYIDRMKDNCDKKEKILAPSNN